MKPAAWASLVTLVALPLVSVGCSRKETKGQTPPVATGRARRTVLIEYLAAKLGVAPLPDGSAPRWRLLYWSDEEPAQNVFSDSRNTEANLELHGSYQECEMPVIELGGAWITDDGELVPGFILRTAVLHPMPADYADGLDVESRREVLNPYTELTPPTRAWLRASLVEHTDGGGGPDSVREFVSAERNRLVRDVQQQHVSWRTHVARARRLLELARLLGLTDGPELDALRTVVDKFAASAAWEARATEDLPPIDAAIASEVNSLVFHRIDGEWTQASTGSFKVEYDWFSPSELRTLLHYWDCDVWTRSRHRQGDEYACVTIGERIRSEARKLMRANGPVDRVAFERWLDGLGPSGIR